MIKENKKEPLKVSLLTRSTSSRTQRLKTRKPWPKKQSERLKIERKPKSPKSKETKKP